MKRLAIAATSALCLAGCETTDVGTREVGAQPRSDSDEAGLWLNMERAEEELRHSPTLNREQQLNTYVRDVVCKVAAEYCAEVRVYVVNSPEFNASMAPNGMMLVSSGLILRAENEAQLAFVVSHETAHYYANHNLENWRALKNSSTISMVFGRPGYYAARSNFSGFSRENEQEADRLGLERLYAAGYDVKQAAEIFRRVLEEQRASDYAEVRDSPTRGGAFNTHPLTPERISSLDTQATGRTAGETGANRHADMITPHLGRWLEAELQRNDHGQTLALLQRLSARGRDLGVLSYYEGELYRRRSADGDEEFALLAYRRAVTHADTPPEAFRQLGEIARRRSDTTNAIAYYEAYLARAPEATDRPFIERYLVDLRGY